MDILKNLRQTTGKTQEDIAEESGYTREYVNALENGRRKMSRSAADALAPVYGTTPAVLMGYQSESLPLLREDRDARKAELDEIMRRHAEELQAKQKEIDDLQAKIARLEHDLDFAQSMGNILKMQLENRQSDPSTEENNM